MGEKVRAERRKRRKQIAQWCRMRRRYRLAPDDLFDILVWESRGEPWGWDRLLRRS